METMNIFENIQRITKTFYFMALKDTKNRYFEMYVTIFLSPILCDNIGFHCF